MPRGKKAAEEPAELSDRERIITQIRQTPRSQRSEEQKATLTTLLRQEARDRFVRNVQGRMFRLLKAMDNVGRLANRQVYEFTDDDAANVVDDIASKLAVLRGLFAGQKAAKEYDFFAKR